MRSSLLAPIAAALVASTPAAATPHKVSDFANVMAAAATRLDAAVGARQQAGDMAAAQRLALAAAMVRRAGEEFRSAEQEALTDEAAGLPAPIPERLAAAVAVAEQAPERAGEPGFLERAQGAVNALMAALPMQPPHPIVYGALSRDLGPEPLPADLVVYGYRVLDPVLKAAPKVVVGRSEIASLTVADDRIAVTLPGEVKTALGFAPTPCESRLGFGLRVTGVYAQPRGIWPVAWTNELRSVSDLYVPPTPVWYAATVRARFEAPTQTTATVPFEARSELVVADCGETRAAAVEAALPPGATDVRCVGEWIDASGAETPVARCSAEGGRLRATGELVGGKKVCSADQLCVCPSAAQGFLRAAGSFRAPAAGGAATSEVEGQPLSFPAGARAEGRLDTVGAGQLRRLSLSVSRRGCPVEVDALGFDIADERAEALSKTGAFRAAYRLGMLSVGAADGWLIAPDKTP